MAPIRLPHGKRNIWNSDKRKICHTAASGIHAEQSLDSGFSRGHLTNKDENNNTLVRSRTIYRLCLALLLNTALLGDEKMAIFFLPVTDFSATRKQWQKQ
jgi:hypothetical protein